MSALLMMLADAGLGGTVGMLAMLMSGCGGCLADAGGCCLGWPRGVCVTGRVWDAMDAWVW